MDGEGSPLPRWHWGAPAIGLLIVWAIVGLMTRRFQRFGIAASGYRTWRAALVGWHLLQSVFWGLMGVALLSVATSSWRMSLVAAVVVYGYTLMLVLVLVHDWIVGFFGSFPLAVAGQRAPAGGPRGQLGLPGRGAAAVHDHVHVHLLGHQPALARRGLAAP